MALEGFVRALQESLAKIPNAVPALSDVIWNCLARVKPSM